MKFLFVFLLSSHLYASVSPDRLFEVDQYIEVSDDAFSAMTDKSSWALYKTDNCIRYNLSIANEDALRAQGLRRCEDNTVSFVQPPSRGAGGWEGKCGHTFGANAIYSICKKAVDPDQYFGGVFSDITPGVRPGTLRKGMGRSFRREGESCPQKQAKWIYYKLGNSKNYIKRIKQFLIPNYSHPNLSTISRNGQTYQRNPVATLIQNPGKGKYLHWVTVVDMLEDENACYFVVNHWDNQYQVPCSDLASWSGQVGRSYPIILKSYAVVSFN